MVGKDQVVPEFVGQSKSPVRNPSDEATGRTSLEVALGQWARAFAAFLLDMRLGGSDGDVPTTHEVVRPDMPA